MVVIFEHRSGVQFVLDSERTMEDVDRNALAPMILQIDRRYCVVDVVIIPHRGRAGLPVSLIARRRECGAGDALVKFRTNATALSNC
jgi:hypothetical protein